MSSTANVVMLTLTELGVTIEKTEECSESLTIFISVPEHSYRNNANGEEMSSAVLAKRIKTVFEGLGVKRLTVKYRVRAGELWTKELSDKAVLEMRKTIFGSQY